MTDTSSVSCNIQFFVKAMLCL